jgi:hypothetical protein
MEGRGFRSLTRTLLVLAGFIASASSAVAAEGGQSPYLKGYRDFMTGVLGPPGVIVRHDLYLYNGTENSRLPQGQLTATRKSVSNIFGVTMVTPFQVLGGNYGFAVRGAFSDVKTDQSLALPKPFPTIKRSGSLVALNDIVITPAIVGWHAGNWHWNASVTVWTPTGNYDKSRAVNTGRNVWGWSPQLGVTYFDPKSGWEVSGAAIYVASSENTDTHYQSGNIAHFDFAAGKMLSPQFKLGVLGYVAQQLSADSGSGAIYGDRKMRVYGLGPGITYSFLVNGVTMNIVAKYYREFDAQNTTQGDAGSLSLRVRF